MITGSRYAIDQIARGPIFDVRAFGAIGNGVADDTAAIQAAITAAAGRPVYVPAGTYKITSTLSYVTAAPVATGLRLYGDGTNATLFDNRVASGPMLRLDGTGAFQYAFGASLSRFAIMTTTSPSASNGIELHAQWQFELSDLRIHGLTGDGIVLRNRSADPDSSAYYTIRRCYIYQNGGWGVDMLDADTSRSVATGAITSGQVRLTATGANFTLADVGKGITVSGAGASGGLLSATVSAYVSSTQVDLDTAAGTTVASGATVTIANMTNACGPSLIEHCDIRQNTGGGVRLLGVQHTIRGGSISYNGTAGVQVTYNGQGTPEDIAIEHVEFDTNQLYNIDVQGVFRMDVRHCRSLTGAVHPGITGHAPTQSCIRVGVTDSASQAEYVNVEGTNLRATDGATYTFVTVTNTGYYTRVLDTTPAISGGSVMTLLTDNGTGTYVRDTASPRPNIGPVLARAITSTDHYAPDCSAAAIFRLTVTSGTCTYTVDAPVNAQSGQVIALWLGAGGAATATFALNAIFHSTNFASATALTAGQSQSCLFWYDKASNVWRQLGAWSANVAF